MFRKSAAFLFRHPVVWLPVLVAQMADFLFRFGLSAVRQPVLLAVAPRSVLGGVAGTVNGRMQALAAVFTWLPILSQVVMLVYGMAVCARWSHALRQEDTLPRTWRVTPGPFVRAALITFFVSTLTVGVGAYFTLRGGVPVQLAPLVSQCFLIASSWFLVPTWLRLVATEQGSRPREWERLPAFLAFVVGLVLSAAILFLFSYLLQQTLLHTSLRGHPLAAAFWITLPGVVLASLPLAFSFVALSRYAEDRPGWPVE